MQNPKSMSALGLRERLGHQDSFDEVESLQIVVAKISSRKLELVGLKQLFEWSGSIDSNRESLNRTFLASKNLMPVCKPVTFG